MSSDEVQFRRRPKNLVVHFRWVGMVSVGAAGWAGIAHFLWVQLVWGWVGGSKLGEPGCALSGMLAVF